MNRIPIGRPVRERFPRGIPKVTAEIKVKTFSRVAGSARPEPKGSIDDNFLVLSDSHCYIADISEGWSKI